LPYLNYSHPPNYPPINYANPSSMKDLNQAKLNENGKAPSDTYKNPLHQSQPFNPYGYYMPQPYNNRLMDL